MGRPLTPMSHRTSRRPMTESEREFLAGVLSRAPTSVARWLRGGANALALWAASLLLFALAWMLVAWALRATVHVDLGWDSPAAGRIAATGAVACALLASVSAARWLKGWSDPRPQLRADLEGGQVAEESYRFTQARRFQEPEHGGLIYFLRTADDEVLALYDHESADLGAGEGNPLDSQFRPCAELLMVRAPTTGLVIERRFSGDVLDAGHPLELAVPPSSWPESEAYCAIPWDQLEGRLGPGSGRSP